MTAPELVALGWVDPAPTSPLDEAVALLRQVHGAAFYSTSRAVPRHTLDAIARYLGEGWSLEQVGWGGCTEHRVIECNDDDGHEWHLVHEDGTGELDDEHPIWPVYRFTKVTP